MRLVKKLPIASARVRERIAIGDAEWNRIGRAAYGCVLPGTMLLEVIAATRKLLQSAELEKNAPSCREARASLERIAAEANAFCIAASQAPNRSSDAASYVRHLVGKHLEDNRVPRELRNYDAIVVLMSAFSTACDFALNDMPEPNETWHEEGMAWGAWVRQLDQIARRYELGTGARNDSDKQVSDRPSSFVVLIRELQKVVPARHRRHMSSDNALARAINRARDTKRKPR